MLIVNELINSRKCSHKKGAIFKKDLENAYDHVELEFVDCISFGKKWRGRIQYGISSTSFSVLVNSSPSTLFNTSRDLRG